MEQLIIENSIRTISNFLLFNKTFSTDEDYLNVINGQINALPSQLLIENQLDVDRILNAVKNHFNITNDTAEGIYLKREYWIEDYIKNSNNPFNFWNNYKLYLEREKFYNEAVIDSINKSTNEILDGIVNPNTNLDFSKKGMVIGFVQSGKTGNYIGLINKALDIGYNFIIVLAGMHNNLRNQTQIRIDEGVTGFSKDENKDRISVGVGKIAGNNNHIQVLTNLDSDFTIDVARSNGVNFNLPTPLIAVIKKNIFPLSNLNQWLSTYNCENKNILIIDDECDQASLNNNFDMDDLNKPIVDDEGNVNPRNTPTAINSEIRNILSKFKKKVYIGYTATPYANILLPIDHDHYKDLMPEDFIIKLGKPSNYIGPNEYFNFNSNDENILGLNLISSNEQFIEQIKNYSKGEVTEDDVHLPESLLNATFSHIVSSGIRYYRGDVDKHISMMIHVSHLTEIQKLVKKKFLIFWKDFIQGLLVNRTSNWIKLNNVYDGICNEGFQESITKQHDKTSFFESHPNLGLQNYSLPNSFEDLKDHIRNYIKTVEIVLLNSQSDDKLEYQNYKNGRNVIVIGGNTMSRGLTLEGLQTSYFLRHSKTFDTLMQMGRWFGYRPNYIDLCNIFTTSEIAIDFEEICLADEEIRIDISNMKTSGATPREFLINLRKSSTGIAITAKKGVGGSKQTSWAGGEKTSTLISKNPTIIKQNFNVLKDTLNKLNNKYSPIQYPNNLSPSRIIYKNIPINELEEIKNNYSIINNYGDFDLKLIFEFYNQCGFNSIDLAIVGRQEMDDPTEFQLNYNFNGIELGTSERNSADKNDSINFKIRNGKLTDSDYLYYYIKDDVELGSKEQKQPKKICQFLNRPVLTFLALNPFWFYDNSPDKTEIFSIDNFDLNNLGELGNYETKKFHSIPFGLSIATPAKNINGDINQDQNIVINITVQNNAQD
jgi:hypothetical protein